MSQPPEETARVPGMESDVDANGDGFDTWPNDAGSAQSAKDAGNGAGADGPPVAEDDPAVRQAVADDTSASRYATRDGDDSGELAVPFREPQTPEGQ